ncbi:MAG TPA: ABC transporter ATP-binding protein [Actinomycetota bacterium]|jgi:NitT/TauT family transport system ATP-binding protein|nr:ABC transporter ATP-binding protein [Actinomycetota bacterium]
MRTLPRLRAVPDLETASPKLSARGVSKSFRSARGGTVPALVDIDLEIRRGEFVCLIGPSGCGKTTLLNLFAGLDAADQGDLRIDGAAITRPGPDRAVLFQEPALFPWLSVLANVEFALEMLGVPKDERRDRAMHWLHRVHLGRFADAQPHELSGGMRQRAAIARALSCQPEVLLADEPFAALDAQTREILQGELQEVWSETRNTFLFVTHNVREAVFLADRVILMSAPPGTLVTEHRIEAPRPRDFEDILLSKVVVDIHAHLSREVEKVVAREVGP